LSDDKIVNLEEYRKERNKGTPIPTLKAFQLDHYYIYPEFGMMIHILFTTFDSLHYDNKEVYIMEDQFGNFFAELVEEDTCDGWHELHKDVFIKAIENQGPTDPTKPKAG